MESHVLDYCLTKPFNSIYKDIFKRSIFNKKCSLSKSVVPDFLLETFECSREDQYRLLNSDLEEYPAYQCRFCPEKYTNVVMIAKEDGYITLLNTDLSGPQAIIKNFKAHQNCIFDAHWIESDHIITSSGDWSIKYIDLNTQQTISQLLGHTGSVKALALRPKHSNIFASSSRDGSILLWDLNDRSKQSSDNSGYVLASPVSTMFNVHHPQVPVTSITPKQNKLKSNYIARPVTSVIFVNENVLASSGCADGQIKLWDIRKISKMNPEPIKVISYSGNFESSSGFTDLIVNRSGSMLFAYCKDRFVYQYDLERSNYNIPVFQYTGHYSNSYYLKMDLSPDEKYLACGSSSKYPYIYHVGLVPQKPMLLHGHEDEVTVCRWCPSNQGILVTVSDDRTTLVHRMRPSSNRNVFYRDQIQNGSYKSAGIDYEPIALSARNPIETVTVDNQYPKQNFQLNLKQSLFNSKTNQSKSQPIPLTPKTKNQSILSFVSPMSNLSPKPLKEQNIFPPVINKIDRSKSVLAQISTPPLNLRKKRSANENKENGSLKRRKTVVLQTIETYFKQ